MSPRSPRYGNFFWPIAFSSRRGSDFLHSPVLRKRKDGAKSQLCLKGACCRPRSLRLAAAGRGGRANEGGEVNKSCSPDADADAKAPFSHFPPLPSPQIGEEKKVFSPPSPPAHQATIPSLLFSLCLPSSPHSLNARHLLLVNKWRKDMFSEKMAA